MINNWRKSTRSDQPYNPIPTCVEIGWTADIVGYRDSKAPHGPTLIFPKNTAHVFMRAVTA